MTTRSEHNLTEIVEHVARTIHTQILGDPGLYITAEKQAEIDADEDSAYRPWDQLSKLNQRQVKEAVLPIVMATLDVVDEQRIPLATAYPMLNPDRLEMLMLAEVGENTRSEALWVRLANGDLIMGFFPRALAYMEQEVAFTVDWKKAEQEGSVIYIEQPLKELL